MSGHVLEVGFKFALYIYFLLYDWRMLAIYWTIIAVYTIIHFCIKDASTHLTRLKIRLATWDPPTDSNIYLKIVVPVEPFEKLAEKTLKEENIKITLTHIALKSIGHAMSSMPGINGKITFGKITEFKTVDVSTLIDLDGKDLAQMTVASTDTKTIKEMAEETRSIVKSIKTKKNQDHQERTKVINYLPDWAVMCLMTVTAFISYNLGLSVSALKIKPNAFGAFMLTNVSALGFRESYAPLCNWTRNAATCVLCEPYWEWRLDENGQNGKGIKVCNFMWTADHRFLDGAAGS